MGKVLPEYGRATKHVELENDTVAKILEKRKRKDQENGALEEALGCPSNLPKKSGIESILPNHCRLEELPVEWMERNLSETGSPLPVAPGAVVSVQQPDGTEQKFQVEYKFVTMKQYEAKRFLADLRDLVKSKAH